MNSQKKKLNEKPPIEIRSEDGISNEKNIIGSIRGSSLVKSDNIYELFLSSHHRRKGFISPEDRIFSISPYVQRNYVGQYDNTDSLGNNLSEVKFSPVKSENKFRNKKIKNSIDKTHNNLLLEKKIKKESELERLNKLKKEEEQRKKLLKSEEEKRQQKEKEKGTQRKKLAKEREEKRKKQLELEAEKRKKQLEEEEQKRKKQLEIEEEKKKKLELEEKERKKKLDLENKKKKQLDQKKLDKINALINEEEQNKKIKEEEDLKKILAEEEEEQKKQNDLLKQQLEEEEKKRKEEYLKRKNEEEERRKLKELQKQKLLEEKEKLKGKNLSLAELNPLIQKFINEIFYNENCDNDVFNNIIQTIKSLNDKCRKLMIRGLKHGIRESADEDKYNKVLDNVYGML